ncbi:Serine/threonine-protein kinase NIM1 [Hypsibius exemplaris]|uniref:Serine/threonine-protein kinase NIM1 n=1 Tax=Hypsibius exemplaris TaxID=2072580 RepID=A0A1W0WHE3_HYPEX|nr:Serine/threonine-protein kinase NIM1 [Hypsibius exemplaris]
MGRDDSKNHSGGTVKVEPDPQMPHSLQVGKMPSMEPDVGSSSTTPANSTGEVLKSKPSPTDEESILPSFGLNAATIVESEDDVPDGDDLENIDTVPEVLRNTPSALEDVAGVGSTYKQEFAVRRMSLRPDQGATSKSLGEVPGTKSGRARKLTAYEQVSAELSNDKKTLKEITLGRRVGFYRIRTELGSGNFSQVKMAVHALTREKVAIKILDKARLDQKTQRLVAREIANMERVHHPNIVRLYEVVETLAKLYLVMEYAGGGELFTKITNEGRLKEPDAAPLLAQVISAMDHLHTMNIIHRDLKAENVFFSGPNTIKVGDFGFSTISLQGQALTTFCGSPPYAAPELFRDESYEGRPVDIWALGIMTYFMVTGMLPFRGETVGKLKKAILEGVYAIPTYLSPACVELITAMLRPVASDRPSIHGLRRFQWLHGAVYPDPLKPFTLNPDDIMHDNLPGEERQARKVLKELGITRDVIQKSSGKQSRSSITGTYRIVLHRIQKQALGIAFEEYANTAGDATESAPSALNTTSVQPPLSALSKGGRRSVFNRVSPLTQTTHGFPGATQGNKVSRLCVIL